MRALDPRFQHLVSVSQHHNWEQTSLLGKLLMVKFDGFRGFEPRLAELEIVNLTTEPHPTLNQIKLLQLCVDFLFVGI